MFRLPHVVTKSGVWDETKHPRADDGKFGHGAGHAAPGGKPASHKETYRALLAQAKATRRAAHAEALATAQRHHEAAAAAHEKIREHNNQLAWHSDYDEHDDFRQLDELVSGHDPDAAVSQRFQDFQDMTTAATNALGVDVREAYDEFTDEDHATNQTHLAAILHHAKEARGHLRRHAAARREARAVRSPDWLDKMFRLPWLVTKAGLPGRWEESKHPRGNARNPGQFRSGGGGGGSTAGPSRTPRMGLFVSATPGRKRPAGHVPVPPPLPGAARRASPLKAPGTGKPPDNLGHPKTPQEATDHIIWLLGRAGILRRQAREGKPLSKKQTRELTMAVNLAGRLAAGIATPSPLGGERNAAEMRARHGVGRESGPESRPAPTAAPTAAPTVTPPDARHNPDLDAAFAAPPRATTAPAPGDLRHNPLLDEAFGPPPRRRAGKALFVLPAVVTKS